MEPEEQNPIDSMSDLQLFTEMINFFGPQRTTELFGWALLATLFYWQSPADLRRQLEEKGMTKAGLYRALRDLRRFGEHIEGHELPARDTKVASQILRRAGRMRLAVS